MTDIKHRIIVAAPQGRHPAWFRNLYKQAFRNFQALEGYGPPLPSDEYGECYSPLRNDGGIPQLQISWKIWDKTALGDAKKPKSSSAIALSGKQC